MNKSIKILLTGILFFALSNLTAQPVVVNTDLINQSQSLRTFKAPVGKLVGSMYVNEEYLPVSLSSSEKTYSVKYNAYLDQMEVLTDAGAKALPASFNYTIDFISLKKRYQVFTREDGKNGFFVVLFEGDDHMLLAKEIVKYYEPQEAKSGYEKNKPPTLKREKNKYFIGYKNNTTSELPSKKKDFYAKFGKHSDDIKSYVKQNKLNIKKEEDLVKLFEYYNSL